MRRQELVAAAREQVDFMEIRQFHDLLEYIKTLCADPKLGHLLKKG